MAQQDHSTGHTEAGIGRQAANQNRVPDSFVIRRTRAYLCVIKEDVSMGASGFPIDLVLFGMIAAFLVLRLRSILGKRTGFERPAPPVQQAPMRPATGPIIEAKADPATPPTAQTVPDAASATGQALARMQEIDRNFDA